MYSKTLLNIILYIKTNISVKSLFSVQGAVKDVVDKATTKEVYVSVIMNVWDLMNAVQTLKVSVPQVRFYFIIWVVLLIVLLCTALILNTSILE